MRTLKLNPPPEKLQWKSGQRNKTDIYRKHKEILQKKTYYANNSNTFLTKIINLFINFKNFKANLW